jgi:hypothetical protein
MDFLLAEKVTGQETLSFVEELMVATGGSLFGALGGAIAAWYFSKRLFSDEAKAREKSEREARKFERRVAEAKLVEAWAKSLLGDLQAFIGVLHKIAQVIKDGHGLDPYSWPINRQAPPLAVPVVMGTLKTPMGATSSVLWRLQDELADQVRLHRQGQAPDLTEATLLIAEAQESWPLLQDALRKELAALYT